MKLLCHRSVLLVAWTAGVLLTNLQFSMTADSAEPPLDLIYLQNPEGRMNVGTNATLSGYLQNNTDRAMLASVQVLGNNQATITPATAVEIWLAQRGKSRALSWNIHVTGLAPTAQPSMKVLRYEGDPISSGNPVAASTPLGIGQKVQVQWNGQWWNGEVLAILSDGRVKIHYAGWDSSWDEAVPRSRLQLANKTFVSMAESYDPHSRGDGECVALLHDVLNIPPSKEWKKGITVIANGDKIPKGTAIATFVDGKYPQKAPDDGKSMHAAIYDYQDKIGIWVWQQYNVYVTDPKTHERVLKEHKNVEHIRLNFDNKTNRSRDGSAFSVIQVDDR